MHTREDEGWQVVDQTQAGSGVDDVDPDAEALMPERHGQRSRACSDGGKGVVCLMM